jgi:SAM-dependent methyltransferase
MSGGNSYDEYAFIADLYDHVGPYRSRQDVVFFLNEAVNAAGPVAEIGCGTGRVLIPIARAGIDIVGIDSSPRMLSVCRERLAREEEAVQSRVRLVEADMRTFELDRRFALVTIPFRPFQHLLTVEDQLACLATIRRHLVAGGRLIVDIFNPALDMLVNGPVGVEFGDEAEFQMPDGRRVVRRMKTVAANRFTQVNDHELIYYVTHPDGRAERLVHAFSLRYLFRFEVEHLLARSGFEVVHVYADYDRRPYGSSYPGELIVTARAA